MISTNLTEGIITHSLQEPSGIETLDMSTIRIEGHPTDFSSVILPVGHLYLVFNDEEVINVYPQHGTPPFGHMVAASGAMLDSSEDTRGHTDEDRKDRGSKIVDIGDRRADDVWYILKQYADQVNEHTIRYQLIDQNSNSFINSALYLVGVALDDTLPGKVKGVSSYPGRYQLLDFDYSISGSKHADTLQGSKSSQTFHGLGGNDKLIGGSGDDKLYGDDGADILVGGIGNDLLTGGAGHDAFVFADALSTSGNVDMVTDFSHVDDTIWLRASVFAKAGEDLKGDPDGVAGLVSSAFWASEAGKAHDKSDRVVYDKTDGHLFYDADGTGKAKAMLFAELDAHLKIDAGDFMLFG